MTASKNINEMHGLRRSREYRVWDTMKQRCFNPRNPKFSSYGKRGITVCARWESSFIHFYKDMGPRPSDFHSLERINNEGNYCPENCKWATSTEQARNNRRVKHSINIAREMREFFKAGVPAYIIADIFETGRDSVHLILKNKIWKEIT